MVRYCWSLTQANNTLVMHNAFLPNRQPDCLNTSPGITRSLFKTRRQRYPQGPSIRLPGKKTKPSGNTYKRIFQQGRSDVLAQVPLHLSCLYAKRTDPSDSALTTELWTVLQYQTSTRCHSSVSYLIRQGAESGLQGWTWGMDTSW